MRLTVNGKEVDLDAPGGLNLEGLLAHYRLDPDRVVVELNLDVPAKEDYGRVALKDGDKVEIVKFLGGG